MINCGIYQWTNKITGKIYIGQSCNLIKRKKLFSNFKSYHYAGNLINEERKKYPSLKYWEVHQQIKLLSKIIINNQTFSNQQIFIYEKQDKYKKVDDKDWA